MLSQYKAFWELAPVKRVVVAVGLGLFSAIPASAADLSDPANPLPVQEFNDRWSFAAAAYVWAAGLNGSVGVGQLGPTNVNASFGDILDDLNFAVMGVAEARYDKFGLLTDVVYTRLKAGGSGPAGFIRATATNDLLVTTVMGTFRAINEGNSSLDVMAGMRLWHVGAELELRDARGNVAKRSLDKTWVDPMVGMKTLLQGDTPLFVTAWGMIGGFGISSDIDGDVLGAIGYEINDRISLIAGYRAYGVDYSQNDFVFDVIQHGPVIAGVINF